MTFDEATRIARDNPGQGIREARMSKGWKVVWIKQPKTPNGGALFCINPITNSDYQFRPTDADKVSNRWGLI